MRLKISTKCQLKSTKWGLFISHLRWWERTPNFFRVTLLKVINQRQQEVPNKQQNHQRTTVSDPPRKPFHPQVDRCSPESDNRGREKHINFCNRNCLDPTQIRHFGPPEKSLCVHFLGKNAKKGPTLTFSGGFFGSKTGPKRAIFGHRKFSLLVFPALRQGESHVFIAAACSDVGELLTNLWWTVSDPRAFFFPSLEA